MTHQFPGSLLTHLLAVAFAFAVAYASALTLAVVESARGIAAINAVIRRDLSHDADLLRRAAHGLDQRILGR